MKDTLCEELEINPEWMEQIAITDELVLICNREGAVMGLPLNRALYDSEGNLITVTGGNESCGVWKSAGWIYPAGGTFYSLGGYSLAFICAGCTISASANVQLVHMQSQVLNSYKFVTFSFLLSYIKKKGVLQCVIIRITAASRSMFMR